MTLRTIALFILLSASGIGVAALAADPAQLPPGAKVSYLDNGQIKLGVDLNRGGAIVFLSRDGGQNVINNFDLGRQVQLSFFSGPVPFSADGQVPADHWSHIGWNPIQAGDDFKNAARVLASENDGRSLHVQCQPMQWPLNGVPGDCTFDVWLELDAIAVKARARLTNTRLNHAQYPARLQELPAVYAVSKYHRVRSYQGEHPFTNCTVSDVPKPSGKHPWSFWMGTENWSALVDDADFGLGLITPGRVHFTGGLAGEPGSVDTMANATSYLAGQGQEILDHDIEYEFGYELVLGSLKEIRDRAAAKRPQGQPTWVFAKDRQGWHYQNATDQGYPIQGQLEVNLTATDPQLISPHTFWRADSAPFLIIEAAYHTDQKQASVYWQSLDRGAPGSDQTLAFPINGDGAFHRQVVRLADSPAYLGALTRLRLDPVTKGEAGAWVKVKSIRLAAQP